VSLCVFRAPLHAIQVAFGTRSTPFDADQNKFSDNEQAKSSRDLIVVSSMN
jgi:hypothetical protein